MHCLLRSAERQYLILYVLRTRLSHICGSLRATLWEMCKHMSHSSKEAGLMLMHA